MADTAVLLITCPHCRQDQTIEVCDFPTPEELPYLPDIIDRTAVCDHCRKNIRLKMMIRRPTMTSGHFFGEHIPGGPIFPGVWFGLS